MTGAGRGDSPIYAALVREWQVGGRTIPGARDPQWIVLTSVGPAVAARDPLTATPPGPPRWQRAGAPPAEWAAGL
ncbi:hypothetical protein ACFYWX_03515 [Streptomyces sp. NPDC002888]|uniref:hypothetical protein n=1 Tax=Streptomyces sp. NPDC002888 TaxID=3364668 RepID=UPI0036885C93